MELLKNQAIEIYIEKYMTSFYIIFVFIQHTSYYIFFHILCIIYTDIKDIDISLSHEALKTLKYSYNQKPYF